MSIPALKVTDLCKSFDAITAADNINVEAAQGEIIGIIGANGAGKTVFVNMITGYLKPTSGVIEFQGADITGICPREATHIGLCRSFQVSQVFMTMTVEENLLVALAIAHEGGGAMLRSPHTPERVAEAERLMTQFGIRSHRHIIAATLSQGMRKLLDIAMAAVAEPKVLLLDEPTSGVSIEEKFGIMDTIITALKEKGSTVLIVEHDMDIVARYVDRVLAFYQGEIICDAPPAAALKDPGVIEFVTGGASENHNA